MNAGGIKSASVHYHFSTKPDLGEALVQRYAAQFEAHLAQIDQNDLQQALDGFVALYSQALVLNESICLCAVMGAEAIGLPENVNQRTKAFFAMNKTWLEQLFTQHGIDDAGDKAGLVVAALEGGMIVASASSDRAIFEGVAHAAVASVIN